MSSANPSSPPGPLVVGQKVRVQPGTRDPDFPTLALDGWTGIIREVDSETPPLCLVEWDETALAAIPAHLLQESERSGLEVRSIWLSPTVLTPVVPLVDAVPQSAAPAMGVEHQSGEQHPADPWAVWRSLGLATVYCAGAGSVLGAVVAAVPGGLSGLTIGTVVLGVSGYLTAAPTARWFRASHPVASIPALASFIGLMVGGLAGGVLGILTAAVLGVVPGCILGSMLHWLCEALGLRLLGQITWVVLGGFIGAGVLAVVTDASLAVEGATAGGIVGAGAGLVLVLLALVGTALSARQAS